MFARAVCALSLSLAAAAALPSLAAATPISPSATCWLIEYPPSQQCEGGGWVGRVYEDFPTNTVPNTRQNTVVRFDDVDAIPSNATVTEATFTAYQSDEIGEAPKEITVYPVTTNWDGGADWLYPWTTHGGDFDTSVGSFDNPGNGNWSDPVDVTDLVQAWVDGSVDNNGLGLAIENTEDSVDHAVLLTDFELEVSYTTR